MPEPMLTWLPWLPFLTVGAVLLAPALVALLAAVVRIRRAARRLGYPSSRAYLQAVPRSDAEKRDAGGLALMGLVLCMLGIMVGPLVLVGIVPLFYGARKVIYASMGLGLIDDADELRV